MNCWGRLTMLFLLLLMIIIPSSSLTLRILTNDQQHPMTIQSQLPLLKDIKLIIDGTYQYIYPSSNNNFDLQLCSIYRPTLSVGYHTIQVVSNQYLFPVLFVNKMADNNFKMNWLHPFDRKIIKKVNQPYLTPIQKINYFEPEGSFHILGFLLGGNGMFILMGLLMVFCYKGMSKLAEAQMAPNASAQQEHAIAGNRGQRRT